MSNFKILLFSFQFDLETFEDKYVDLKWLEGKMAQSDEQVVQNLFLPDQCVCVVQSVFEECQNNSNYAPCKLANTLAGILSLTGLPS